MDAPAVTIAICFAARMANTITAWIVTRFAARIAARVAARVATRTAARAAPHTAVHCATSPLIVGLFTAHKDSLSPTGFATGSSRAIVNSHSTVTRHATINSRAPVRGRVTIPVEGLATASNRTATAFLPTVSRCANTSSHSTNVFFPTVSGHATTNGRDPDRICVKTTAGSIVTTGG